MTMLGIQGVRRLTGFVGRAEGRSADSARPFRIRTALCCGCLLAAATAGCGSDEDETASSGEIKVGLALGLTGATATTSEQASNAYSLALDEINANRGVLGQKLTVEIGDTTDQDAGGTAIAQKFIDEGLEVILGPQASNTCLKMLELTVPAQKLLISHGASSAELTKYADDDWFFRTVPSQAYNGTALARIAYRDGLRTMAVLVQEGSALKTFASAVATEFTAIACPTTADCVQRIDYVTTASPDYDSLIAQAAATSPHAILLASFIPDATALMQAWSVNHHGFTGKFYASDSVKNSDFYGVVGDVANGVTGASFARPNNAAWTYFKGKYEGAFAVAPGIRTAEAYDATMILAFAMAKANSSKAADVRTVIRDVANPPGEAVGPGEYARAVSLLASGTDINYEGASGNVNIDADGDVKGPIEIWEIRNNAVSVLELVES